MQAMKDAKHCPLLTVKGLLSLMDFFFKKYLPDAQNLLVCVDVAPEVSQEPKACTCLVPSLQHRLCGGIGIDRHRGVGISL